VKAGDRVVYTQPIGVSGYAHSRATVVRVTAKKVLVHIDGGRRVSVDPKNLTPAAPSSADKERT
jgi:hypothetical protein